MKKILLFATLTLIVVSAVFTACSKKEDFREDEIAIVELENGLVFRPASLKNQPIEFRLYDDNGDEITEAVVYYVDNVALEGNTFVSASEGTFEVFAEFLLDGEIVYTEVKTFSVVTPKVKTVVEDYTGTWCGYCPAVSAAIDNVYAQTNNITTVAIHNNDEMALPIEPALRNEFGVFGFPSGRINRTTAWGSALNFPPSQVTDLAGQNGTTAISINSSVSNGVLAVKVSVASENELQNTKLVVYVTEDGILSDQVNYFNNDQTSPYFGLGDPIVDFEQNHVLRASLSDAFGNLIPSTSALTDYETNFSYEIPSAFVIENLSIVVMVVDMENNAINSQSAAVGENKFYE
ncbi:MAG: Omp28-related outer membrane protein [Flavobacteriaceae bacterium]